MRLTVWTVSLLTLFAYSHGSTLELPRKEYTVPEGRFCVSVVAPKDEPPGLNIPQQINWYSKPQMTLELYVEAFLQDVFNASASKFKLDNAMLYVGQHNVHFKYIVDKKNRHTLTVNLDGRSLEPTNVETYYTTDSIFKVVKVYARGPLHYDWDTDCSEETVPTTTEPRNPSSQATVTPPHVLVNTTGTTPPHVLVNTTGTTPPHVLVNTTGTEPSVQYQDLYKRGSQWRVIFWSILGSVAAVIILICITALVWSRHQKQKMVSIRRRMKAEQEKQKMMREANRLSYQEQQTWVGQRPSSPIFQPPVMYSALSQRSPE